MKKYNIFKGIAGDYLVSFDTVEELKNFLIQDTIFELDKNSNNYSKIKILTEFLNQLIYRNDIVDAATELGYFVNISD